MIFFTDVSMHEVLGFTDFLLETTVVVGMRLEAESSVFDAIYFNIARVRVCEANGSFR
jgi:hypothetical protein